MNLEVNDRYPSATGVLSPSLYVTPAISEDYWIYRVTLNDAGQAILGFPKFGTVGIGFAHEEDWNTNLPFGVPANQIYDHIRHNQADDSIQAETVIEAIEMVRQAAAVYLGVDLAEAEKRFK